MLVGVSTGIVCPASGWLVTVRVALAIEVELEGRWYLVYCSDEPTQGTRRRADGPGTGTFYLVADEPLGPFTWFRVGGNADALFIPADAPHQPVNIGTGIAEAIVARNDASEQENVAPYVVD